MRKKLLLLPVAVSASLMMLAGQAFASDSYLGHITGYFDITTAENTGDVRKLTIDFDECDGTSHSLNFSSNSNLDTWVEQINRYMDTHQFLNVGMDPTNENVQVMATVGGSCDQIDQILEVYRKAHDLPEGHVLAEPPRPEMEDEVETNDDHDMHVEMGEDSNIRTMADTGKSQEQMNSKLRQMLVRSLRHHSENDDDNHDRLMKIEQNLKERVNLEKHDTEVEDLENRSGLLHVNPIKLDRMIDKNINGQMVTLRGIYQNANNTDVLVNGDGNILVNLDLQNKDYSSFVGDKVFVKGLGNRSEKLVKVDSMRMLNKNESDRNNAEMTFRVGASLYNDVDTDDDSVWYTKYLAGLFDDGVFTGYEDGSFGGANPVTIGEISKVVSEAAHEDVDMAANITDAKYKNHWAKFYLKNAATRGLLKNIDAPDRPATRAEVIQAILKAFNIDPSNYTNLPDKFPDTKDEFIRKAFELGIVGGFPDGNFRPNAATNRAEVAKMITLAKEKLGQMSNSDQVDAVFNEVKDLSDSELQQWIEDNQ